MRLTPIVSLTTACILLACTYSDSTLPKTGVNASIESAAEASSSPALDTSNYWYSGDAEITSYHLQQARYGELHDGSAVLVYVSEPFNPDKQVKVDAPLTTESVTVLKMNQTRKFNTGIYPYSMMTSVFAPIEGGSAIKVSTSSQEWCGHTWTQLNQTEDGGYRFSQNSYFESEGDQVSVIPCRPSAMHCPMLEDDLWIALRTSLDEIKERAKDGPIDMVPGTQFLRLRHLPHYPQNAHITFRAGDDGSEIVRVEYQRLERIITFHISSEFPRTIEAWEESFPSGFGPDAKWMTTTATINKRIKVPYWNLHGNQDTHWRSKLGLD